MKVRIIEERTKGLYHLAILFLRINQKYHNLNGFCSR